MCIYECMWKCSALLHCCVCSLQILIWLRNVSVKVNLLVHTERWGRRLLLFGFCFGRTVWIQPHWRSNKWVKNFPPVSCTHFHDGKLRKCVDKVQLCTVSASWIKLTVGGMAFNWQTGTGSKEAEQQAEEALYVLRCSNSRLPCEEEQTFPHR